MFFTKVMGDRPRIKAGQIIGEVVIDGYSYKENKGSKNARKIINKSEQIHVEVWYDKHYINRNQFGNDDGSEREGIDEYVIQKLVSDSLCHLIHYSFVVKSFAFINSSKQANYIKRVVLQKITESGVLNIVVGFYHITNNHYEVTVYTALITDDFRISDGQYVLCLEEGISELKKFDNKKLIIVEEYP